MEPISLSLPNQRNYSDTYGLAYELACQQLSKINDLEQQCRRSGATCQAIDSRKIVLIDYLNRSYQIALPDVEISLKDSQEEVPLKDKIIILHYFIHATGKPLSRQLVAFKELKEAPVYFPTFVKRAIKPLTDNFGKETDKLPEAAKAIGGRKTDLGDAAVTIDAFTHVPITLVLWRGDEEFPPEGNILFDSTVSDYLPTEDIIVLCQTIAWKLVRAATQIKP